MMAMYGMEGERVERNKDIITRKRECVCECVCGGGGGESEREGGREGA